MKKQLLLITAFVSFVAVAYGGGIVTNSNQSAYWVRTLVRDAAIGPDAVYFNPAGLTRMEDGFHFSLNNQTIFQNKDVTSSFLYLNPTPKKYEGDVKAPVFPGIYGTWKKSKIAVSFGFNPIGGGGGAEYKTGLPSFESQLAGVAPAIQPLLSGFDADMSAAYGFDPGFRNITGYNADIYFKGTSIYFGYQLGVTYQITDIFSAYVGARLVTVKNTYEGHIKDFQISVEPNPEGNTEDLYEVTAGNYTPGDYLRGVAAASGGSASIYQPMIYGFSGMLDAATADREVDAEETGMGFAPILGLNISPSDKLNIGLKYEFKTKLELETTVNDNKGGGLFMQDSTVYSDMPAMASVGVEYKVTPRFTTSVGFHYYFDKGAKYGKTLDDPTAPHDPVDNDKVIDNNYFEIGLGLEYGITENFLVSAGYLYAKPGVTADYQSDLSYALPSSTVGFGFGYKITEKIMANIGASYSIYQEGEKTLVTTGTPTETYFKDTLILGIGLDFSF